MILKINPEYNEHVLESTNGRKYLYGRVLKAIYDKLLESRLIFDELTGQLKIGFLSRIIMTNTRGIRQWKVSN